MLKILHEADNICIKGYTYKVTGHSTEGEMELDCLHLDCSILVNGKIKNIGWSFTLKKEKEYTLYGDLDLGQWSMLYTILYQLGYPLESQEIIYKWISDIIPRNQLQ